MSRPRCGAGLTVLLSMIPMATAADEAGPIEAKGSVELADPSGDQTPIGTSGGSEPALDIVGLKIASDGEKLTVTATLAGPPGKFADEVVTLFIDADDDPATGVDEFRGRPAGFDHRLALHLCMAYDNGVSACGGGTDGEVTERWAEVQLERFEGDHPYGPKERLIGAMAFSGKLRKSERVPVTDLTVTSSILYSDIGVAPGRTIVVLAEEASGSAREGSADFPVVRLKLD